MARTAQQQDKPDPLPLAWFNRCPVEVARDLIGTRLCKREADGTISRWLVTETEAYNGAEDKACHASKGHTDRTSVLFGPQGRWYVYLCYGVHWMLNIVTREEGFPSAVLFRGISGLEPGQGFDGPGKLTKQLGIDKSFNKQLAQPASDLWLEPALRVIPDRELHIGPRIGIDYAGSEWVAKPWRFLWLPEFLQKELNKAPKKLAGR
ncbi:MAG: DNA-3-methyladenine glycosylase [Puniceicoccales bacterium]|jgi:DNA-3-methyladenine glycosylase|nr:DNA-3-methyladenine glycosylase [Puniceicoccales bacterium]